MSSYKKSVPARPASIYRGVRLQAGTGKTHFTEGQLRRAVEKAIRKNADVLARKY